MVVSPARSGRLWMVNDSGNAAELVALDVPDGTYHRLKLVGGRNRDWEDLATFTDGGKPWIAIGDIGDNFAVRGRITVLLLPEPDPESPPGGEGVARVDSTRGLT